MHSVTRRGFRPGALAAAAAASLLLGLADPAVPAQAAESPVLPGLTADPNIIRFGDTYYIYPTTDGFPNWSGTQFKAYSSKDLVNWKEHGVILDLGPDISWPTSGPGPRRSRRRTASTTSTTPPTRTSVSRSPTRPPAPSKTPWASR
ncbi:hypothetical protein SSP24_37470 [Streptomyces spinoverrucosus]|uniref:Glycosyl hydrolase family 43 n=1 Tax=Streptomyces spinoverrucosus TaxID=284043 RepID=A0A4Y3VG76_9ACTN|nr:hypothetical protein SSP24_37470 [Streptomyces spinoverrucosus]GHB89943.1 hypothetical protein GCM10010397_72630 [Streptomyces spinoverrucosus]